MIPPQASLVLVISLLIMAMANNTAAISHRAEHLRRLTELVSWIMFSLWFTFLRKTQDKDCFQVDSEAYDNRLSPTAALDNGDPVKVVGTLRFFAPHPTFYHRLITSAAFVTLKSLRYFNFIKFLIPKNLKILGSPSNISLKIVSARGVQYNPILVSGPNV